MTASVAPNSINGIRYTPSSTRAARTGRSYYASGGYASGGGGRPDYADPEATYAAGLSANSALYEGRRASHGGRYNEYNPYYDGNYASARGRPTTAVERMRAQRGQMRTQRGIRPRTPVQSVSQAQAATLAVERAEAAKAAEEAAKEAARQAEEEAEVALQAARAEEAALKAREEEARRLEEAFFAARERAAASARAAEEDAAAAAEAERIAMSTATAMMGSQVGGAPTVVRPPTASQVRDHFNPYVSPSRHHSSYVGRYSSPPVRSWWE